MKIAAEGATFVRLLGWLTTGIFLYAVGAGGFSWIIFLLSLAVFLLVLFFYRDYERIFEGDENLILSPSDGRVIEIIGGNKKSTSEIAIFLSIFDVHVIRVPVNGKVKFIKYVEGKYHPGQTKKASRENAHLYVEYETRQGIVIVRYIAGVLARRILWDLKEGSDVKRGQKVGIILLGSRVEIHFPRGIEILVNEGDKVYGGLTPVAKWIEEEKPKYYLKDTKPLFPGVE